MLRCIAIEDKPTRKVVIPEFDEDITTWLDLVNACLADSKPESTDIENFLAIIAAIPTKIAKKIENVIIDPPRANKYNAVGKALKV